MAPNQPPNPRPYKMDYIRQITMFQIENSKFKRQVEVLKKQLTELREALRGGTTTNQQVVGTVKRFNVKRGYGFINHSDTRKDIFVHKTGITRNNPYKVKRSAGEDETVEFDVVVGEKRLKAANVTGPDGKATHS